MASLVRCHLFVTGRVQGVGYREGARRRAISLGVSGFAHNLADGRVELVLEGGADAVEAVVSWCRSGPAHAQVIGVTVAAETPVGLAGFSIF